jgi:hypothetical protein
MLTQMAAKPETLEAHNAASTFPVTQRGQPSKAKSANHLHPERSTAATPPYGFQLKG